MESLIQFEKIYVGIYLLSTLICLIKINFYISNNSKVVFLHYTYLLLPHVIFQEIVTGVK